MTENPNLISHVSLGTNDLARTTAFYDTVMPTLGAHRLEEFPGAVAYGNRYPEFWVQTPIDGEPARTGNGTHLGFVATTRAAVHAFWEAALAAGASPDGPPGPRPAYGPAYYGCFVRDLDGHKVEATFWDESPT
ncbi:MAG: VOC family protein [Alphaproteobacteria bacterium]